VRVNERERVRESIAGYKDQGKKGECKRDGRKENRVTVRKVVEK